MQPPQALRRAQLDNLALVPANLLPYKEQYQHLANELPKGEILIILPEEDLRSGAAGRIRQAVEKVANQLKAAGQKVTTLSAHQLGQKP
jgi:hypothetical protein